MKKVLIATTNKDKYKVVSRIFKNTIFPENEYELLCLTDDMNLPDRNLFLGGSFFKRMEIPPEIPERLRSWYTGKEIYIGKYDPARIWAFSDRIIKEVRKDFMTLAPLYHLLRGCADEIQT